MKRSVRRLFVALIITAAAVIASAIVLTASAEGSNVAKNLSTGAVYTTVESALSAATSGQTVLVTGDAQITSNCEIRSGVTLIVPYDASGLATEDGTAENASPVFATPAVTYRTLTVRSGVTLQVNGTLTVGGIIGYPGQYYQGHTSGAHGRIVNRGKIVVSGTLESYGFIEGPGSVTVGGTGRVYEPFVVFDFAGGTNTKDLNSAGQPPFSQYTMQNISCQVTLNYGGRLIGKCSLYASDQYNKTDQIIIGGSSDSALVKMKSGGTVSRTVDKTKRISGATAGSPAGYGGDIGRVKYTFSGGATFGTMKVKIMYSSGMSTTVVIGKLTLPYCLEYCLQSGTFSTSNTIYVLPGGGLTVGPEASFTLNGKLFVFDGLKQSGMSGKYYPSSEQLAAAGFATNGVFTVDGSFSILKNATFGGIIQTTAAGANVTVNSQAVVDRTYLLFGGSTTFDDNTSALPMQGRLLFHGQVTELQKGTTYTSYTGRNWILEGYDILKYTTSNTADNKTYEENVHVRTDQNMSGEWTCPGHTIVTHPAKDPTCTETGNAEYFTCSEDPEYTTYVEIPAFGHDYDSVTVTEATYVRSGLVRHTCGRCGHSYDETLPRKRAAQYTMSLSFEDSISINFYIKNIDPAADLESFRVVYTFGDSETSESVSGRTSNRFVVATCSPREAGDNVNIKVYYRDELIKETDCSVRSFCERAIADKKSSADLKAVCLAALDYCACAQAYYEYKADKPVNATYSSGTLQSVVIPDDCVFSETMSAGSGLSMLSVTLHLSTKTGLVFGFRPAAGVTLDDLVVELDGIRATSGIAAGADGTYSLTLNESGSVKMEDAHTLSVTYLGSSTVRTVVFLPMSSAWDGQSSSDEKTADLAKSFYSYCLALNAFVNAKRQ